MADLDPDILSVWMGFGFSSLAFLVIVLLALVLSSYVKIATVLAILRAGLGFNSLPSVLVTGGLAVSLAFFSMYPTMRSAARAMEGVRSSGTASEAERVRGFQAAAEEWKHFVVKHAHAEERARFAEVALRINTPAPAAGAPPAASSPEEKERLSSTWQVLAPSFVVSQLKEAFKVGLTVILPLFVIDLLVAHILVALGLTQLSPILIALPFKLVLFVAVGGWSLITSNLVATYAGG